MRPDKFATTRAGFSGSDDEVHFNGEGVAGWGGSEAGARRFFVKVYDDGGKFGGIKNSSRSSLLEDQQRCSVDHQDRPHSPTTK